MPEIYIKKNIYIHVVQFINITLVKILTSSLASSLGVVGNGTTGFVLVDGLEVRDSGNRETAVIWN